jgi:hypothetical protein
MKSVTTTVPSLYDYSELEAEVQRAVSEFDSGSEAGRIFDYSLSNHSTPVNCDEWLDGVERFITSHKSVIEEWDRIGHAV